MKMIINKRLINIKEFSQRSKKGIIPKNCTHNKLMTHKFTNAQILIKLINEVTKIGETQILEIINRNPEITKRGRPITKREHENSPTRVSQNGTLFQVANH